MVFYVQTSQGLKFQGEGRLSAGLLASLLNSPYRLTN